MSKILVVDDHPLVRKGIAEVLAEELNSSVIGEASNSAEAMNAVWNDTWDLVLLDISLPGRGGLELLSEIRTARPKLPVLILSAHPENQFATRVLKAGASGYLTKASPSHILLGAVRQILAGGKFISQAAAELLAMELNTDSSRPVHQQLSDREYDVMIRIARGQSVSEIGDTLSLSVKTVSTYRARVLQKMGLKSNADLIHYALRNSLVE
jgi:DNA-binding NarL/FixJ family response regulator